MFDIHTKQYQHEWCSRALLIPMAKHMLYIVQQCLSYSGIQHLDHSSTVQKGCINQRRCFWCCCLYFKTRQYMSILWTKRLLASQWQRWWASMIFMTEELIHITVCCLTTRHNYIDGIINCSHSSLNVDVVFLSYVFSLLAGRLTVCFWTRYEWQAWQMLTALHRQTCCIDPGQCMVSPFLTVPPPPDSIIYLVYRTTRSLLSSKNVLPIS